MARKPDIDYEEFSQIELRIARIIAAEYFKNKRNLIRLFVDLGDRRSDMIVGKGLPDLYTPQDLIGRRVVWMANLTSKKIVGDMSNGMIVAVGDNHVKGLVQVDDQCRLGTRVR